MNRREACIAMLPTLVSPRILLAQVVGRMARIGFLVEPALDAPLQRAVVESLREGLRELGYIEGRNISIDFRSADGKYERLPALATELMLLKPDLLVTAYPTAALVAKDATRTLPVVAVCVDNPVLMGLAATFARPGGNFTGVGSWAHEIVSKRLQVMRELVPNARRLGILFNPLAVVGGLDSPIVEWERTLGIPIQQYKSTSPDDFEGAFAAMARDGVGGLVVLADSNTYTHRVRLNQLCLQRRMPSVWGGRDWLMGGALASYQSDFPHMFRRSATLIDKILKGTKPGDIPFEQSNKLELVIDTRAARALGITVPKTLLLSADHVIE
ncbi:ABC transporter substrate-binding protein [Variovorax humicola]|uniref:ABC transporter substrate-binding protein n=1 Tax=Variovorax humicola TaxID=1769758 RepID=A0ABU8W0U2_9BURK